MSDLKVSVAGSYTAVLKVPAAKSARSLPDPAIRSTLPVCMRAAWMARTGDGLDAFVHVPSQAAAASTRHATAKGLSIRRIDGLPYPYPGPPWRPRRGTVILLPRLGRIHPPRRRRGSGPRIH